MIELPPSLTGPIQRHKTAIRRPGFSRPIQCLLRDGLLNSDRTIFDYGCGRGQDVALLQEMAIPCEGWDPVHRPRTERAPADIVNLGYVINVIEDPRERADAVHQAWGLTKTLLVVAAQIDAAFEKQQATFADGVLTSRGTFQKYYAQQELRSYLEDQLGTDALPAAPGIFYLFRDETAKQQFLASRYRREVPVPPRRISEILFDQNRDILEPFMQVLARLGRLPGPDELPESEELSLRLGSLKRAFALVRRVTEEAPWEVIARRRSEDLLVYLALARFRKRPPFSQLTLTTQRDVKAFFGTYQRACTGADALLFGVGNAQSIDDACQRAPIGHLVENALLVPRLALGELEPLLRIYEGCARALLGEMEEANIIKIHRYSGKVSYLAYRDFDADPSPALQLRVKVSLRSLDLDFFDYSDWDDPPLLDSKDAILRPPAPAEAPSSG